MAKSSKPMSKAGVPHGRWPSPISAAVVAQGARRFGIVQGDGEWVYWTEGRPKEKGRQALLRKRIGASDFEEVLAEPWSARSRVHEYGGGEFLAAGSVVYFVNDADQDIYVVRPGEKPTRLTKEPALRFADMALDRSRQRLIAVAERHHADGRQPDNFLAAIGLSGKSRGNVGELVAGRDFYSSPRFSPGGEKLAFIAWDLPDMPWDQSELLVADVDDAGIVVGKPRHIAGGKGVAAQQPRWASSGALLFVSDETGTGQLYAFDGQVVRAEPRVQGDLGPPQWNFGLSSYQIADDGTYWAAAGSKSGGTVLACKTASAKRWTLRPLDASAVGALAMVDGYTAMLESGTSAPQSLVAHSAEAGGPRAAEILRHGGEVTFAKEYISRAALVRFPGGGKRQVYGLYYPPTNPDAVAPKGSLPPALVLAHGGPTASAGRALNPRIQFYTSRGFAVLDVDYAGSTGYGRDYRSRLDGQWGIADVEDCAAGAAWLAKQGKADPARIAIAGGSAGGYTTLMSLAMTDAFAAGSSHYGISDLALLMQHTHKFESGYLHRLLGTTPKAWKKVCQERSPLTHIDRIKAPLILFQGLDDRVVPPEQSRLIADKLKAKGRTVELHEFASEGHGFRRADTVVAVLEAELAFLLQALKVG